MLKTIIFKTLYILVKTIALLQIIFSSVSREMASYSECLCYFSNALQLESLIQSY